MLQRPPLKLSRDRQGDRYDDHFIAGTIRKMQPNSSDKTVIFAPCTPNPDEPDGGFYQICRYLSMGPLQEAWLPNEI